MTATTFLSTRKYAALPLATRQALEAALDRSRIVGRYACNVESDLKALGEHDLARLLYR